VLGVWLPAPLPTPRALPDRGTLWPLAVGVEKDRFERYRCLTLQYSLLLSVWVDPSAEHILTWRRVTEFPRKSRSLFSSRQRASPESAQRRPQEDTGGDAVSSPPEVGCVVLKGMNGVAGQRGKAYLYIYIYIYMYIYIYIYIYIGTYSPQSSSAHGRARVHFGFSHCHTPLSLLTRA